MRGYDSIPYNADILLDLPFYEGTGTITRDQAKPHHQDVTLVNVPTWDTTQAGVGPFGWDFGFGYDRIGLGILTFDGTLDYIELASANCVDLDFIAGDYSIACWFKWTDNAASQIVMARYELDVSGWELYLYGSAGINYLTLRHHHAGTLVPPITGNPRSGCYSVGWTPDVWWFMGISREGGGEAVHYQNGILLPMVTGGLVDPETCGQDLVIGVRYTKNANYYLGSLWRPRVWNRALAADEWLDIFEDERKYFGV